MINKFYSLKTNRMSVIGEALGARDHNVTILSPYPVERPPNGVRYIFVDSQNDAFDEYTKNMLIRSKRQYDFLDFLSLAWLTKDMCLGKYNLSVNWYFEIRKCIIILLPTFKLLLKLRDFKSCWTIQMMRSI